MSIVSMSMTWMSLNPVRARLASISHPKPPAPITRILHLFRKKSFTCRTTYKVYSTFFLCEIRTSSPARKDGSVRGPGLSRIWSMW
jgi:hypothetical protein